MDRRVVDAPLAMPERDRFERGMVAWVGFRQTPVPYQRVPPFATERSILFKMMRFTLDGVTSFSVAPLHGATWIGLTAMPNVKSPATGMLQGFCLHGRGDWI